MSVAKSALFLRLRFATKVFCTLLIRMNPLWLLRKVRCLAFVDKAVWMYVSRASGKQDIPNTGIPFIVVYFSMS